MARFMQKFSWDLQQKAFKLSKCSSCNVEFFSKVYLRHSSRKSKYRPVRLAYEIFEPKGGSNDRLSPLIFLHGITSSKEETWGDLPQVIADQTKRKAYNLDARNHGDSEWSDEFDFDLNAEDLLHFIDKKNFRKVVIIGHSMGGLTGIKAALKEPERIEMLFVEEKFTKKVPQAFMDDALRYMNIWKEAEKFIPPGLNKEEADAFITEYVMRKLHPQNKPQDSRQSRQDLSYPLEKDYSGHYFFKANLEVVLEKMKNADAMMVENEGIYEGPAYFIYATKSQYQVGKEKHHILKHFPKAIFIPFEGSKHFVHKAYPDLFVETVVKFIKQNEKNE
ncbi:protein ABHD11-like [Argiope bruennichi]|nr:protein ABHD11-like [Argiope bruennichi]